MDQLSNLLSTTADLYADQIEKDLDASSGCVHATPEMQLDFVAATLEQMHDLVEKVGAEGHVAGLTEAVGEMVYERLEKSGRLDDLASAVGNASNTTAKTHALDVISVNFGGTHVAEFSHQLEKLGGETGRQSVTLLSASMAKVTSADQRVRYINGMSSRMLSGQPFQTNWKAYSRSEANPNSAAVAKVWGSLKNVPAAFEYAAHSIDVHAAVEASVNEKKVFVVLKGSTQSYSTGALADLLKGAASSSSPELKQQIFSEASIAVDKINNSPATKAEDKQAAVAPLDPKLAALREQLSAGGASADSLSIDGRAIATKLRAAIQKSGEAAVNFSAALAGTNRYAASQAIASLNDTEFRAFAIGLKNNFYDVRLNGHGSDEANLIVEHMNGTQLNRLVNVYLKDDSLAEERGAVRVSISGLAQMVAEKSNFSDRLELIQNLVPHLGRERIPTSEGQIPNPESTAVAVLLANMKTPQEMDIALRVVPLGEPLRAVFEGGMIRMITPNSASFRFDVPKAILDGASRTNQTEWKRQLASDARIGVAEVRGELESLSGAARSVTDETLLKLTKLEASIAAMEISVQYDVPGAPLELRPR